jgi:hypothetical protein
VPDCHSSIDAAASGPAFHRTHRVFARRVRVPDVVGMRPLRAKCRLEETGLSWRFRSSRSKPGTRSCDALHSEPRLEESSRVAYQSVRAGRSVPPATVVRIDTCGAEGCA